MLAPSNPPLYVFVILLAGCVASVEGEQMGMAKQEVRRGPIGGVEEDEGRGQGRGRLRRETLVRAVKHFEAVWPCRLCPCVQSLG